MQMESRAVPSIKPAHAINVVRNPYLSSRLRKKNGHPDPTMFFVDKQIPNATARLQTLLFSAPLNHSPSDNVSGLNTSAHPKAANTPCVAISCQTCVLSAESMKLVHASTAPQIAAGRRYLTHRRVNSAKKKGIERYMTPLDVVPMMAVR